MSARSTALATLRRCREAVRSGLSGAEVDGILGAAMQVLERPQQRPVTEARLDQFRRLQRQLARFPERSRGAVIRERTGWSKQKYYRLSARAKVSLPK